MLQVGRPVSTSKKTPAQLSAEYKARYRAKGLTRSALFVNDDIKHALEQLSQQMRCSYQSVLLHLDINKLLDDRVHQ